jgi:DNA-binding transcriptional regulator YhcF (GntR family)
VSLQITIDPESGTALFEQLRAQVAARAREGDLPVGYRMPTVRGLAEQLGLAVNTVAKAYRVLESDGVIETRGRHGTFIAPAGDAASRRIAAAAADYAQLAHRLGVAPEAARAAVDDALRAVHG